MTPRQGSNHREDLVCVLGFVEGVVGVESCLWLQRYVKREVLRAVAEQYNVVPFEPRSKPTCESTLPGIPL